MKNRLLFLIIATHFLCCAALAQDIIVTTDAKKIDAKITEVTKSEIRYKEFDNQGGPTFILGTDDIVAIIYSNNKVALYCSQDELSQNLSKQDGEVKSKAEAEARAKAEAERKAKEQVAIAKASQLGSTFGSSGKPVGRGNSGAVTWSLAGRECKAMSHPSNNFSQEGKVVISIQVNEDGDVVSAAIGNGTTVSDYATQQIALKAARETKFSEGETKVQIGTITYVFKFK